MNCVALVTAGRQKRCDFFSSVKSLSDAYASMRLFNALVFLPTFFFKLSSCIPTTIRVGNLIYLDDLISEVHLNLTVDQIIREKLLPEDFKIE